MQLTIELKYLQYHSLEREKNKGTQNYLCKQCGRLVVED